MSVIAAPVCGIRAGRALRALGHTSCKRQVSGSNPLTGSRSEAVSPRRTIKPALGHLEVREIRGPILDQLYARLKRCGDLSCTGRPFTEHRNVPVLVLNPRDRRPA
jgi:hypothetical protein